MDFLHKFEAPAFPSVHGGTVYNSEAAATSCVEDGAGDEPFRCLRVNVAKDAWSCLCEEGESRTS